MATGDQDDFVTRLRAWLPRLWFPEDPADAPVLTGLLSGLGAIWSALWLQITYVAAQRRIATATDVNLDIIANDYLGTTLPRHTGEPDTLYRARVKAAIFQEAGTRRALVNALTALNGQPPTIFEPANAMDTGGWGRAGSTINTGLWYGKVGGYGSYQLPYQVFVKTNEPSDVTGIGNVQGYGSPSLPRFSQVLGGYGSGAIEYVSGAFEIRSQSESEVYTAINAVKPVATIVWVATSQTKAPNGDGPQPGTPLLDVTFVLDVSRMS